MDVGTLNQARAGRLHDSLYMSRPLITTASSLPGDGGIESSQTIRSSYGGNKPAPWQGIAPQIPTPLDTLAHDRAGIPGASRVPGLREACPPCTKHQSTNPQSRQTARLAHALPDLRPSDDRVIPSSHSPKLPPNASPSEFLGLKC
jgi:hypothetical protein